MAYDEFEDDDPYRQRVQANLGEVGGPTDLGSGGIAGPQDGGYPSGAAPQAPPVNPYDYEKFRQGWLDKGFGTKTSAEDLANYAKQWGVTIKGGDAAYDPNGKWIADLIGDVGGRNTLQFLKGSAAAKPPTGISPPGALIGGQSVPGSNTGNPKVVGGGGTGGAPPAANTFLTEIRKLIMERLGKMSFDPSMSDPALAAQSNTYRVARERGATDERAALAERAAAQGQLMGGASSGAFDTEIRGIQEAKGEDIAGNDAQLLGAEVQQRRAEVQSLMNMALQSGDAESARMLQMQLAKMDEAIRLKQLAESKRQFDNDLGYRNRTFDDQFGRNLNRDTEDDYRWRVLYGMS